MTTKLLALYGLKWNPFASEVPPDALLTTPKIEAFCWRIEHAQVRYSGLFQNMRFNLCQVRPQGVHT